MKDASNFVKISISTGNRKMGAIPSVSLPPVVTCAPGVPCAKKCYACKMCRIYKNVGASYNRNLEIVENNPDLYWSQVNAALTMNRFFRFHVSGDIINDEYMEKMVESARNNSHCEVLVFTKQYDIVNKYVNSNGALPDNLHLIFSLWDAEWNKSVKNPHNFPTTTVIFKDGTPGAKYDKICGGNCFECAMTGGGCWDIKSGECLAFYEH